MVVSSKVFKVEDVEEMLLGLYTTGPYVENLAASTNATASSSSYIGIDRINDAACSINHTPKKNAPKKSLPACVNGSFMIQFCILTRSFLVVRPIPKQLPSPIAVHVS
jgi:hypothetical protein